MNKTKIEWTDLTWNPIRARSKIGRTGTFCTRISPGCQHCYASTINKRFGTGLEYTVPNLEQHEFYLSEKILQEPLLRKKPAKIFVGDMFDLFHETIPDFLIAKVFSEMAYAEQHTFQVLTKRTERMQKLVSMFCNSQSDVRGPIKWPLPNVWLGTSVESQKYADERTWHLRNTPAAVRFLSVEPQLEAIVLPRHCCPDPRYRGINVDGGTLPLKFDWVIVGGESGPGARPFNLAWAESLRDQCKRAGVAFFLKQVGSNPWWMSKGYPEVSNRYRTEDRKGGDMSEWPEDLRIREFPR